MIANFSVEYICGRKFQLIADTVFDTNILPRVDILKDKHIIWCKINLVETLFDMIKGHTNRYILITHNGDWSIDEFFFHKRPRCIVKWFAQNVNYKHVNLIPLPIGLENDEGPSKGGHTNYKYLIENVKVQSYNKTNNVIYCNFNCSTNPIRESILEKVQAQCVVLVEKYIPYSSYCEQLKKFLFVLSPPGNGIDCHRTWEALYFGCIPVVERHFMYDSYSLPIIQVSDWLQINNDWLYEQSKIMIYKYEMLTLTYWFDLIKKERDVL